MTLVEATQRSAAAVKDWFQAVAQGWDQFWFAASAPHSLALIRILGGAMLFYTHLVWALDLDAFLGPQSWVSREANQFLIGGGGGGEYTWSYLWYLESPAALWTAHIAALFVFAALTVGFYTRVSAVLAWIATLAYCHRLQGALFGLDQVNAMIAMYLVVGPSGAVYSVDAWWRSRRQRVAAETIYSVSANVAIRLIQVHLSVVYLFGGISKLKGTSWWDGSAVWFAVANYEYQSLDMTWLAHWPWLIALLSHATVFWETFYPVLVWPRLTRPVMLTMAVAVHGGIALCLGMPTFGLAMIIANVAFVPPGLVDAAVGIVVPRRLEAE
ncbi:MAG: HTTM domain-containing protein [Planctomycetota bacterium]